MATHEDEASAFALEALATSAAVDVEEAAAQMTGAALANRAEAALVAEAMTARCASVLVYACVHPLGTDAIRASP